MKKLIILFSFVFYLFGCSSEQNKLENENPNEELTAVEYYNRGIAKWYLKLEYCSDYKKACELGACDNYNTACK